MQTPFVPSWTAAERKTRKSINNRHHERLMTLLPCVCVKSQQKHLSYWDCTTWISKFNFQPPHNCSLYALSGKGSFDSWKLIILLVSKASTESSPSAVSVLAWGSVKLESVSMSSKFTITSCEMQLHQEPNTGRLLPGMPMIRWF